MGVADDATKPGSNETPINPIQSHPKPSSERIMECRLRCNMSECSQELGDNATVWITSCEHVFCDKCGRVVLGYLSVRCPVCQQHLSNPSDIMTTELNPPAHFKKMVLLGLSPDDCMQAAGSGIRFWQLQQQRNISSASGWCAQWQKYYHQSVAQMSQEIAALRAECKKAKEELVEAQKKVNIFASEPQQQSVSDESREELDRYWNRPSSSSRSDVTTQAFSRQFLGNY